jgi:hypothetical protein
MKAKDVVSVARDVTVVATLGVTLFAIFPTWKPSTQSKVEIKKVALDPNVTLGDYTKRHLISTFLAQHEGALDPKHVPLSMVGTVVEFQIELSGLRGEIPIRWSLFDSKTRRLIGESEALDPIHGLVASPRKKDLDVDTWELWIDTSKEKSSRFFVRVEAYSKDEKLRLTYQDSKSFRAPAQGAA